uniref:Uncharacterized protein n=1 Tax=Leersia perrieri TaxID=77586 RepID=A0A0D9WCK3_9ORYZ
MSMLLLADPSPSSPRQSPSADPPGPPHRGPWSGKGTQSTNIVMHFGFTHPSVGDRMGAVIKYGSKNGYIDAAKAIPELFEDVKAIFAPYAKATFKGRCHCDALMSEHDSVSRHVRVGNLKTLSSSRQCNACGCCFSLGAFLYNSAFFDGFLS